MQPRLRATVRALPTSDGVLFRMGDDFLPITGRQTFEFVRRLTPYLDGRWTLRALTHAAPAAQRPLLRSLLRALRDGGMVYDATREIVGPDAVTPGLQPFAPRVETLSSRPGRALAAIARTRVLVLGSHAMSHAALAALGELGLRGVTSLEGSGEVSPAMLSSVDVVAMLGHGERDREWMVTVERACERVRDAARRKGSRPRRRTSGPVLIPLVVDSQCVTVGPVLTGDSDTSFRRLSDVLDLDQVTPDAEVDADLAACAAVASSVLVQKILDIRAGLLHPDDLLLMHEIDAATLEVRQRPAPLPAPLPAHASLARLGAQDVTASARTAASTSSAHADLVASLPTHVSPARLRAQDVTASTASAHTDLVASLLDRVTRTLVDPQTGLIARLDEQDLCQIPLHQSCALWREPGSGRAVSVTDTGATIIESRMAAARRVLEAYLQAMLASTGDPHAATGVVVSAVDEASLRVDAYFQALARFAHASPATLAWTDVPLDRDAFSGEAALTFAYLTDLGEIDSVRVERCVSLPTGCEVLRLTCRDRLVSVIAGVDRDACAARALCDAWLEIAGPATEASPSGTRYRHAAVAASVIPAGAPPCVFQPLTWPERGLVDPLRFMFARMVGEESRP
jgi:hypothetical protein